jgi:uncharacterized protein (DUF1501 family)
MCMRAAQQAAGRPDPSGTVLIVLQLAGGNDGLNTVVPYEDDQYGRNRTTLRLASDRVHKIGSGLGLHPDMQGFARLFHEGHLSVAQGVGYPNMHRGHNAGMRNWQTASLRPDEETGWLGRVADRASDPDRGNVPAVFVGEIAPPLAIHAAQVVVPGIRAAGDWTLRSAPKTSDAAWGDAARVATTIGGQRGGVYPGYPLAQSLRTVGQLIRAELGIRIFLTEQGGVPPGAFDNHANQAGNHAAVLRELSESVAAFCDDLTRDRLLDRVLLMTYSEFGRTLSENGRHGTGHGAAAPVFLAGGGLKGGLIGAHPSLTDLDNDAPRPHTDFRALYATVLDRWLHLESEPVLGARFAPLDILA